MLETIAVILIILWLLGPAFSSYTMGGFVHILLVVAVVVTVLAVLCLVQAFLTRRLPGLEMYAPIVSRGPAGSARVALTFDDGPHPVTTRRVLEIARADPPPRDVLRAGREGAPPSRRGARDPRGRSHARHPRRLPRPIALVPDAVDGARPDRPGGGRGGSRNGRAAPVLPSSPRPHQRHDRTRRAPRGRHARRLVVARLRRPPRANGPRRASRASAERSIDGAIVMLHDAAEHDDFEPASVRALPQLARAARRARAHERGARRAARRPGSAGSACASQKS